MCLLSKKVYFNVNEVGSLAWWKECPHVWERLWVRFRMLCSNLWKHFLDDKRTLETCWKQSKCKMGVQTCILQSHDTRQESIAWPLHLKKLCLIISTTIHHFYNTISLHQFVNYLYKSLWLILIQCKWTNTIESGCVPKNSSHGNRYDYVAKIPRDVELEIDCLKARRFKTPTCVFRHPPRIFLQNFESHRRVRRSAAGRCERRAHRNRKLFLRANLL